MSQPVRIFFSYSHEDDRHRIRLEKHLKLLERQGLIEPWSDRKLLPGAEWAKEIDQRLERADLVLFLVSADFVTSEYCWGVEMKRALERHEVGEVQVVPVIVRDCDWHGTPFGRLLALPEDGKAVTSWANEDEAWAQVARGLRRRVETWAGRARCRVQPGRPLTLRGISKPWRPKRVRGAARHGRAGRRADAARPPLHSPAGGARGRGRSGPGGRQGHGSHSERGASGRGGARPRPARGAAAAPPRRAGGRSGQRQDHLPALRGPSAGARPAFGEAGAGGAGSSGSRARYLFRSSSA